MTCGAIGVTWKALRADIATMDRMMEVWRPRHARTGGSLPALIGAGLVIALIVFFASSGGRGGSTGSATPMPEGVASNPTTLQAAAAPVGDQHALNEEGKQLLKQGRWEEAIQRFQFAFDADPTAHDAYEPLNNMAFCLYELDRRDEALAKWQQALAIEPNSPDANAGLGMLLYVTGRQSEGIGYYRKAVGLNANYTDETWLRSAALWSERAITDSREVRSMSGS